MKRFTLKKAKAAYEKVLAQARQHNSSKIHYVWIDKNGLQCVCDGFRAYRLGGYLQPGMIDGFEDPPKGFEPIDLEHIMSECPNDENLVELDVPSDSELKAMMKKSRKARYDFGEGKPCASARYLREVIDLFPDARLYSNRKSIYSPIWVKSGYGDAAIMPCRKTQ